jgi:hypothetical protein
MHANARLAGPSVQPARLVVRVMKNLPRTLVQLAVFTAVSAVAQTVPSPPAWKWRDASGQVNVSDLPPPASVPAQDVLERPPIQRKAVAAAASAASAASTQLANATPRTDPELEARRKRAVDDQADQQRQRQERDAAVRADNCIRASAQLALFNDGQRIARTNAQGEREVLDDKTRADEVQRARAVIASDCR